MRLAFLLSVILLSLLSSCRPHKDKEFLVTRIRAASKLATMEVLLSKVIISDLKENKFLKIIPREGVRVVFSSEATVKYGIRLDKIRNQNISVWNDSIRLLLPPIEILEFDFPHEKVKEIYPLSNFDGIRNDEAKFLQLDAVLRLAEADIRKKLRLMNLEEEAKLKTIVFLEQFLNKAGYYNISIRFQDEKPKQSNERREPSPKKQEDAI